MNDENAVRKQKLLKIERVVERARRSPSNNPATWRLLVAGIAGLVVVAFFEYSWSAILIGWLGGSVCGYFWMRAAKYQTWDAYIYALLADYDPVNKEAYAGLQEKAKKDEFYYAFILMWIDEERSYMGPSPRSRSRRDEDKLRARFLSKKP